MRISNTLDFTKVKKSGDTMSGNLLFSSGGGSVLFIAGSGYIGVSGAANIGFGFSSGSISGIILNNSNVFFPVQAPTASAPAYVKGGMYFDTTLNKLRIGGATGWETVTSA